MQARSVPEDRATFKQTADFSPAEIGRRLAVPIANGRWPMSLIVEQERVAQRRLDAQRRNDGGDHDLPVLGAEQSPHIYLDWQSLIDDGVPPCLLLGAERRMRGHR